jgi:hypothetical protein
MNSSIPHPDSETLLRLVDDDLSATESARISQHLVACADCRDRLQAAREALDDYARFHRDILKPSFSPPGEWPRLQFPKTGRTSFRPAPWLVAAAVLAALFVLVRRFEQSPEVRAAELLRKAAVAEQAAPPFRGRIRIRTRSRTLDRDARLTAGQAGSESAGASALHELFDAAGYSWDNPLSVQAFSLWRASLQEKQDRIEDSGGVFLVRTFTRAGQLTEVALSLRRPDLHAFACTLRFRSSGEIVYLSELPAETLLPHRNATTPEELQSSPIAPAKAATAGDEVHVIAALHGIGADLGEPVEILRDGPAIVVRISGLDEHRRVQIRVALSGIPGVQLRFEDVPRDAGRAPVARPQTAVPTDRINPLVSDLAARLGSTTSISDVSDELIDATDRAAERAFSLRALARRFPLEVTSRLSRSDDQTLRGILGDHAAALVTAMQEIRRLVAPVLPNSPASPAAPGPADWQALAEGLPAAVDHLDRTLNGATDANDARKTQLDQSIADLELRVTALQRAVLQ